MVSFVDSYKVSSEVATPPPDWAAHTRLARHENSKEKRSNARSIIRNATLFTNYFCYTVMYIYYIIY
jgi:hypothetical protein